MFSSVEVGIFDRQKIKKWYFFRNTHFKQFLNPRERPDWDTDCEQARRLSSTWNHWKTHRRFVGKEKSLLIQLIFYYIINETEDTLNNRYLDNNNLICYKNYQNYFNYSENENILIIILIFIYIIFQNYYFWSYFLIRWTN